MSFVIPRALLEKARNPYLLSLSVTKNTYGENEDTRIPTSELSDEVVAELIEIAQRHELKPFLKSLKVIQSARSGNADVQVPNIKAFEALLENYIRQDMINGWLFWRGNDDILYPMLVTRIEFKEPDRRNDNPEMVALTVHYYGDHDRSYSGSSRSRCGIGYKTFYFAPGNVIHKRVSECLMNSGLTKESRSLIDEHEASVSRYMASIKPGFAEQFRFNGLTRKGNYNSVGFAVNRKVINDDCPEDFEPYTGQVEMFIECEETGSRQLGLLPIHPLVRVFDLLSHDYYVVNSDNLTPYEYHPELRDKLILPEVHKDLLDILTTNLDDFITDIIEGKSAGNIILCKGIAGVGKTLTAEVYAELIERPLYAIRSGTLGTNARSIEENLQKVFKLAKRWNCVLLLDEADVFVCKRGDNIDQNAIVAEFLRTLEYFDGLLFMTTNRPDDIDEAIISRCAALIDYAPPSKEDARKIWKVMAHQFQVDLPDPLLDDLLTMFPNIAPRDIKLLLRLALRMSIKREIDLNVDIFRQCAMFRAIKSVALAGGSDSE